MVAVVLVIVGFSPGQAAADGPDRWEISPGVTLPYYASYPLSGSSKVTGAVVVIHGTERNAEHYFELTQRAAAAFGDKAEIVAPWFQTNDDKPSSSDAYWTNGGDGSWKDGGDAVRPKGLSSYDVIDQILRKLADKSTFPHLTKITLLGHSAGAQFIQRYAAGAPSIAANIHIVVANPSSYLYLNSTRPASTSGCSDYNDYKYGLDNRNRYMRTSSDEKIVQQYTSRQVTYLLGEADTVQNGDMDESCPANAQGENRFERGKFYFSAIHSAYPSAPQDLSTVPGVGHDNEAMINSAQGKAAIFRGW
ncbi:hypothetical protein [Fodinicola feengrottensis]|uniref:hypothetical protein n=1 Tax=Fodinicola feengrottensis TaxID=435914 RepID=UPI0031D26CF7